MRKQELLRSSQSIKKNQKEKLFNQKLKTNYQMSTSNNPLPKLLVAVDIEACQRGINGFVLAVGFCYGTSPLSMKTKRWCMLPPGVRNTDTFCSSDPCPSFCDQTTWSQFWCKHTDVLTSIIREGKEANEQWMDIIRFVDNDLYAGEQNGLYKVKWLSDNPAYDIAYMDVNFSRYMRPGLRYSLNGTVYHGIDDPSEQETFHPKKQEISEWVKSKVTHTHFPDDDATGIFLKQWALHNNVL